MKNLPIIQSHTFVFPKNYHKAVFNHIRINYYLHVTAIYEYTLVLTWQSHNLQDAICSKSYRTFHR